MWQISILPPSSFFPPNITCGAFYPPPLVFPTPGSSWLCPDCSPSASVSSCPSSPLSPAQNGITISCCCPSSPAENLPLAGTVSRPPLLILRYRISQWLTPQPSHRAHHFFFSSLKLCLKEAYFNVDQYPVPSSPDQVGIQLLFPPHYLRHEISTLFPTVEHIHFCHLFSPQVVILLLTQHIYDPFISALWYCGNDETNKWIEEKRLVDSNIFREFPSERQSLSVWRPVMCNGTWRQPATGVVVGTS